MSFARSIEREWLDTLPANDPRAMRSRRDLRRVNAVMLQPHIMANLLRGQNVGTACRVVELGGGDGTFMLRVARRLGWRHVELTLVDQQDIVSAQTRAAFSALGWRLTVVKADVFGFLSVAGDAANIVTSNLFLHHFSDSDLTRLLGGLVSLTPLFVACEPRRSTWALLSSRMLFAIGCNDVSRHDAVTSVRAGFADAELSRLWPGGSAWRLNERGRGPFTHSFVAVRA